MPQGKKGMPRSSDASKRAAYVAQQTELEARRADLTQRLIDAYIAETDNGHEEYAEMFYGEMLRERGIDTSALRKGHT